MRAQAKRWSAANRDGSALRGSVFGRRNAATRASSLDADGSGAPSHASAPVGISVLAIATLSLLAFAPGAFAAKIPGGPPVAIFGPTAGTCSLKALATGTGDLSGATGKGDKTILATGSGKRTSGSPTITSLTTSTGTFTVGEAISGTGIPVGTTIIAVGAGELTMSANATSGSGTTTTLTSGSKVLSNVTTTTGTFTVGQPISGTGIATGTTITAVGGSTLTLSIGVTSAGTGITLTAGTKEVTNVSTGCGTFEVGQTITGAGIPAATTIAAVGGGTLTLSKQPTTGGSGVALSATTAFVNFGNPQALAIDEAAHRLYSYQNNPPFMVFAFNSPGLTGTIGGFPLTVAGSFGFSSAIAVDNTSLASAGRLYFADRSSYKVYAFEADGTELNVGNGFPNFPITVPGDGFNNPALCGAAVDSAGDLWLGDEVNYQGPDERRIHRYSPSGAPLGTISSPGYSRSSCGLGFDSDGDLFASPDTNQGGSIWKYTAASGYDPLLATAVGSGTSVAVDKGRNLFYAPLVTGIFGGTRVQVRTTEGDLLGEFADGISTRLQSVAIDEAGQRVYVSDGESKRIYAFGFLTTPDVTTGTASGTDATHETLRGTVNPLSIAINDCHFEYTPEAEFAVFGFGHAVSVSCAPSPGSGSAAVDVSADLSGLPPATGYRVRLVAGNANGRTIGASKSFTTLGPVVHGEKASDVTSTSATLEAKINPNGEGTSYRFQYVGKADFEESGWAEAASVPAGVAGVGNGNADVAVSQPISGLAAGGTYRFRAVATNASATLAGRGSAVTTLVHDGSSCANAALRSGPSAHLPDCRAYEQVSPVEKNGFDIDSTWVVLSSPDGNAVAYPSTGAFAGTKVGGFPNTYAAHRTDTWRSEGISPPKDPMTDIYSGMVYGASADFRKQLVATNAKLTPDTTGTGVYVYVHDSADDSYQFVASIPVNDNEIGIYLGGTRALGFAGASSDGSSFFFNVDGDRAPQSTTPPPPTGKDSLYEFDTASGELKLVGILPDDTTVEPSGSRSAHISEPGYVFVFEPQLVRSHPVSTGGAVFWTGGGSLYRRENGHSTLVTSGNPKWWGASPDGSHAFYQVGEGNLQRYDAATENSTDTGVSAAKVLGFSDDGEYVYFLSQGAYAPGSFPASGEAANLYAWHNGSTRLIARLPTTTSLQTQSKAEWRVSPNGRYLGLLSGDPMIGPSGSFAVQPPNPEEDNNPYVQAYLYDYEADSLDCASCPAGGGAPSVDVSFKAPETVLEGFIVFDQYRVRWSHNLNDSGQLFFNSRVGLVAADTNEKFDVYEYEAGRVSLISSGQSGEDSWFADASVSGDDVFFHTREGLVGQDSDPNVDLYDARVGGGLASQAAGAQGAVCQDAEQCHGAATAAPTEAGPGTAEFEAPPQQTTRRCPPGKFRRGGRCVKPRCRAGKVRRNGRCVKRNRKRHARARNRAARHDRRAGK